MKLPKEHKEFENSCRRLIGLTIIKVEYLEISYVPENPGPNYSTPFPNIDSIDFSVYFHTSTDRIIEISWERRFYNYGIGIRINEPYEIQDSMIKWDVSNNDLWEKLIGKQIDDLQINWKIVSEQYQTGKIETFIYPQDIKITFSNKESIFISAAEFKDGYKECYTRIDNLIVTDNEALARQVKMID